MKVINVKDFSFTYPNGKKIINQLSFSLDEGEMLLLCGENGCGKSTLLRSLKREVAPKGEKSGEIELSGSCAILFQECDKNIIFRSAYEDLIFPACNSGMPEKDIKRKADEILKLFDIEYLAGRNTDTLSGGEKQLLALASLLMLEPSLLILDEPLSQLDEQAKDIFLDKLLMIKELGTAVIIAEHNTDRLLEKSEKVIIFEKSGAKLFSKKELKNAETFPNFPEYINLEHRLSLPTEDFSLAEALSNIKSCRDKLVITKNENKCAFNETVLSCKGINFSYNKELLKDLNFEVKKGEISFITGKNGAGKTTLLYLLCSFLKPSSGTINTQSKIGYLAQNPVYSFLKDKLIDDYKFILSKNKLGEEKIEQTFERFSLFEDLKPLLNSNPLDFSGGERAKAALFKPLMIDRNLLILDEPEKHLDKKSINELSLIIKQLAASGISFIIVSHSPDFIYRTAHSVNRLSGGKIQKYSTGEYFPALCETSLYKSLKGAEAELLDISEVEYG